VCVMCVRACVCICVLNVGRADETFRVLTGTVRGGGQRSACVGLDCGFLFTDSDFFDLSEYLFVCLFFLLIVKFEFVSFDNSAGSIPPPHPTHTPFFSQNFISSFIC
jgi:hypothetical protein